MKQQVNPAVAAVCVVVVLGLLIAVGMRVFSTPTPASTKAEASKTEQVINGHKVPPGVPSDYMQQGGQARQSR